MFTVFCNGTREEKIVIPPDGQKVNSAYSIESVLRPLAVSLALSLRSKANGTVNRPSNADGHFQRVDRSD
jgi:hypothetical protein